MPYPNNMLRNVGRSSVPHTNYIFVVDVDMMCNGNLYSSFLGLAQRLNLFANSNGKEFMIFWSYHDNSYWPDILSKENAVTEVKLFGFISDKRVFVVPAFESVQKLSPSLSKKELLDLWNSGTIQPFYYQACWRCQKHLDYEAWKRYRYAGVILWSTLRCSWWWHWKCCKYIWENKKCCEKMSCSWVFPQLSPLSSFPNLFVWLLCFYKSTERSDYFSFSFWQEKQRKIHLQKIILVYTNINKCFVQ